MLARACVGRSAAVSVVCSNQFSLQQDAKENLEGVNFNAPDTGTEVLLTDFHVILFLYFAASSYDFHLLALFGSESFCK